MSQAAGRDTSLEVGDLTISYSTPTGGLVRALDGVSVTVTRGEVRGVAGESGSGKSTLVRAVLGILESNSVVERGTVRIHGVDAVGSGRRTLRALRRREVGYIGQNPLGCLHPLRSVRQHLVSRLKDAGVHPGSVDLPGLLEVLGIRSPERVLQSYAHQLSGGMAQRVITAIALAPRPTLVIADEPTSGLDLTVQRQVLDELVAGVTDAGASLLVVTHDLGVVANYCDTVSVMHRGTVVEDGQVARVLTAPGADYTRHLLESIPRPGDEVRR